MAPSRCWTSGWPRHSSHPALAAAGAVSSPTITSPAMMTAGGVLLGTAAYMSPEQARGKAVDKRSDIWAFGAVLYEMLTGKRAFAGEEIADVLAAVLTREPDWTLLPAGLRPGVATLLRRCLHKDRTQRIRDIGDAWLALDGVFDGAAPPTPQSSVPARPSLKWALSMAAAAVAAALLTGFAAWSRWPASETPKITRFQYVLPEGQQFRSHSGQSSRPPPMAARSSIRRTPDCTVARSATWRRMSSRGRRSIRTRRSYRQTDSGWLISPARDS